MQKLTAGWTGGINPRSQVSLSLRVGAWTRVRGGGWWGLFDRAVQGRRQLATLVHSPPLIDSDLLIMFPTFTLRLARLFPLAAFIFSNLELVTSCCSVLHLCIRYSMNLFGGQRLSSWRKLLGLHVCLRLPLLSAGRNWETRQNDLL